MTGSPLSRRSFLSLAGAGGIALAGGGLLSACGSGSSAGNTIRAAIAGEPDQLDPHKSSSYFTFQVLENVFDTLVEPDEQLTMRPALAESWTVSPDDLVWTFTLRPGLAFHNGDPCTAADVVYSYRRIIDGLRERGAQGVILGCTEITLLIDDDSSALPVFDSAELHAAAAVDWMLDECSEDAAR